MSGFIVMEGNLQNFNQQHFVVAFFKQHPVKNEDGYVIDYGKSLEYFCITTDEKKANIIADALNIFIEGIEENEASL